MVVSSKDECAGIQTETVNPISAGIGPSLTWDSMSWWTVTGMDHTLGIEIRSTECIMRLGILLCFYQSSSEIDMKFRFCE